MRSLAFLLVASCGGVDDVAFDAATAVPPDAAPLDAALIDGTVDASPVDGARSLDAGTDAPAVWARGLVRVVPGAVSVSIALDGTTPHMAYDHRLDTGLFELRHLHQTTTGWADEPILDRRSVEPLHPTILATSGGLDVFYQYDRTNIARTTLGGATTFQGVAADLSQGTTTVDAVGQAHFAWATSAAGDNVYHAVADGTPSPLGDGLIDNGDVAVDAAGRPHVVWRRGDYGGLVHSWFDGVAWQESRLPEDGIRPRIAIADGTVHICYTLYVAFDDYDLRCARADGADWIVDTLDAATEVRTRWNIAARDGRLGFAYAHIDRAAGVFETWYAEWNGAWIVEPTSMPVAFCHATSFDSSGRPHLALLIDPNGFEPAALHHLVRTP